MGEILGGKDKVGIQDEARKRFPDINIVGLQFGMADRAKAMAGTENILAAHPDLAGVFADNESSSAGALQALKSRGASQVKLVAFDASDQLIASLREGAIDSLVVQNPFRMGYESTRAIGLKLSGQAPKRVMDSGAALIRREDLDREETKQLLFPDIQKYLKGN
jgi:ribose transport system substrate-binding protein